MIDLHDWPTPNGHKIAIFRWQASIHERPATQRAYAIAKGPRYARP